MFLGIGFTTIPIIIFLYKRINAQREREVAEGKESGVIKYTPEELRELGDKAPEFRYML